MKNLVIDSLSQILIDDISFFRGLCEDLVDYREYQEYITRLEEKAFSILVENINIKSGNAKVEVAVIGNFNCGKSSFINSLLNKNICPVKANPTTSSITKFIYSDKAKIILENREIKEDEYFNLVQHHTGETDKTKAYEIEYYYPFEGFRDISLYDTAGFDNPKNQNDEKITIQKAKSSDVILFVININDGDIKNSTLNIIKDLKKDNSNLEIYLIVNWADTKDPASVDKIVESLRGKYSNYFKNIILYSAKEVIEHKENYFEDIFNLISKNINSKLDENLETFELNLKADKTSRRAKKYEVNINGEIVEFQISKSNYAKQKEEILKLLNAIGENKNRLIIDEFSKKIDYYIIDKKYIIDFLIGEFDKKSKNKNILNNNLSKEFEEYIEKFESEMWELHSKLKGDFEDGLQEVVLSSFEAVECSNEEKSFTFTPYAKIVFFPNHITLDKINNASIYYLKTIFQESVNYLSIIGKKFDIPELIEWFSEARILEIIETINKNIQKNFINICNDYYNGGFNGKYFEDKEEAQKTLNNIDPINWNVMVIWDMQYHMKFYIEKLKEHKGKLEAHKDRDEQDDIKFIENILTKLKSYKNKIENQDIDKIVTEKILVDRFENKEDVLHQVTDRLKDLARSVVDGFKDIKIFNRG